MASSCLGDTAQCRSCRRSVYQGVTSATNKAWRAAGSHAPGLFAMHPLDRRVDGKIEHWAVSPRHEDAIESDSRIRARGRVAFIRSSASRTPQCLRHGVATGSTGEGPPLTRNRYLQPRLGENGIWFRKFGKPNSRAWLSSISLWLVRTINRCFLAGMRAP